MLLTPGTRLGPHEIVAPLGAGGMGEVYLARDTRLGRDVAIKGLPESFAATPERLARFEREARLLASLNHPNIAAIYGLEESSGTPYLVLELIEGESLAGRLTRGPLPVREALDVCIQIAAGMEAAHERGVVHRDLKPANVMLSTSGAVKVLDFGLAKGGAAEEASSPDLSLSPTVALAATGAGVILGTAPYMSPEQARGRAVDRGADVWAFGCVLFECLTGRQVFAGETVSDVIARILEREPDWNALPPSAPARLRDVLKRCLTKDAAARPRDIGDLRRELGAIATELSSGPAAGSARQAAPSLAVLYFENLARDPESEYFCAGITEDILTDLSKVRGLRVASRNAVARYRGASPDLPKLAADLGVGAVLEGSVRRSGDRVRISVQLVNAADGFQLWAERYDRTMEDVFAVQEEIAASIAEALRVTLSPGEVASLAKNRPQDARAYDLYLRGRAKYGQYTEASLREALELFGAATEADPEYALAWAGIGDCHGQLCQWGLNVDVAETARRGLEAARRAIAIAPRLPDGYKAESLNLRFMGDLEGTERALIRALEADPRFTPALINMGIHCLSRTDLAGAERYVRRALEVDPQDAFSTIWLSVLAHFTRRGEEALTLATRVRALSDEDFYITCSHAMRILIHLARGEVGAAAAAHREASAVGARPEDLRALGAAITVAEGGGSSVRAALEESAVSSSLVTASHLAAATAAIRLGELDLGIGALTSGPMKQIAPLFARIDPGLHPVLDLPPFAPRRLEATLVWPLEAPMLDASVHRLFREVRIESGLPPASDAR